MEPSLAMVTHSILTPCKKVTELGCCVMPMEVSTITSTTKIKVQLAGTYLKTFTLSSIYTDSVHKSLWSTNLFSRVEFHPTNKKELLLSTRPPVNYPPEANHIAIITVSHLIAVEP